MKHPAPDQPALPLAALHRPASPPPATTNARTVHPIHVSGFSRTGQDFYATPAWVTEALLHHIRLRGPVWEPCCGDGAMSRVLAAHGYDVVSTDIADRGFGTPGIDVLACRELPANCASIVTNPPYGDSGSHEGATKSPAAMLEFLRHAMTLAASVQGQLALLVRLQWIAGKRAAALLSSGPFAATIVLTHRIRWFDHGAQTNTAQHHHAWIVIDHAHPINTPPSLLFA